MTQTLQVLRRLKSGPLTPLQALRERWVTPPEVWEPLMREFNFDLDAAADDETARLSNYLSDSLETNWNGERIWLNPPYGKKLIPFVRKASLEASKGKLVVALIPLRVRGSWWHEAVLGKAIEVRCVRKRIKFLRPDGTRGKYTGSQDSCIVIWDGYLRQYLHTRLTSWSQGRGEAGDGQDSGR